MERLRMETVNITDKNIEKIFELFPNVVTETKDENGNFKRVIDFDKLKLELSDNILKSKESYDFTWVGKNQAVIEANRPIRKTLRPDKNSSVNFETTENIYIEGDNLDALKLLQESYLNKIKMIYIDPPYNTGKDFIYNDSFAMDSKKFEETIDYRDEEGNINFRKNEAANPRYHSDWCSMIYPRLKLARNLLSDDGLIFISIDDNEIDNLKKICDEVFGADNFVVQFIYEKTQHFGRQKLNAYSNVDYVVCYAKSLFDGKLKELLVEKINSDLLDAPLYNASNNVSTLTFPKNTVKFNIKDGTYKKTSSKDYELINPVEVKNGKNKNSFSLKFRSRWSANTVLEEIKKGTTFWVKTDSFAIRAIYGDEKSANVAPKQIIFTNSKNEYCAYNRFGQRVTTSETATNNLNQLMDANLFSYPKAVSLLSYLISIIYDYKNDEFENDFTVLDFFSGSATTAHACMELNAKDNGKRKFILIQLPETVDKKSEAYKAGYKNICEIGKERIRRAGKEILKENSQVDVGFRTFKVDESNMKDIFYSPNEISQQDLFKLENNIKDDRSDEDLLYGCLLDLGMELSLPHKVEVIDGKRVHIITGDLIACFEDDAAENVIKKIAEKKPKRVVFRDSTFPDVDSKINVEELFKLISPDTKIKVV